MPAGRRSLALAAASAALGGAVVAVAVALFDVGARVTTTTVVQQAPLPGGGGGAASGQREPSALTPQALFARDAPSVVHVRADVVRSAGDGRGVRAEVSTGTAFAVAPGGRLLTAAHVVAGAVRVTVALGGGRVVAAEVLGKDPASDLALLGARAADGLRALDLGTVGGLQVGDPVVAIASPYGDARTLTTGVVSGRQADVRTSAGVAVADVVQTDAAVDAGGSGAPLLDATGRVVGVATRLGGTDAPVGETSFVIPADTAARVLAGFEEDAGAAAPSAPDGG